jgi:SAM-dependent methyltransferase
MYGIQDMQFARYVPSDRQNLERELRDSKADDYVHDIELSRGAYWMRGQIGLVLQHLCTGGSQRVYDAGTGVGMYSLEIARQYPDVSIMATDFSPRSVEMLLKEAERQNLPRISGMVADIITYAPEPASFDRAICNDVLQHLPSHKERLQAVRNIWQSLRPDGIFVTSNYRWGGWIKDPTPKEDRNYHGIGLYRYAFTEQELGSLLQEAGFRSVHSVGIIRTPRKFRRHLPPSLALIVESTLTRLGLFGNSAQYVMAWGVK